MNKSLSYNSLYNLVIKNIEKDRYMIDFENIIIDKKIGSGNFGIVCIGYINRKEIALKYCKNENNIELLREIEILKSIKNNNIPKFYGISIKDNKIYLLMEKINGYTLKNIYKNNPSYLSRNKFNIIIKIVDIIYYLHTHKPPIIYRDLKLDNIILREENKNIKLYLIDFGLSRYYDDNLNESFTMTGNTGSLIYMSPEVLSNMPYNLKADIYSLGILIYIIVKQKYPKKIINYDDIITEKYEITEKYDILIDIYNKFYRKLVKNCIKIDINDRYDIHQVRSYLHLL